MTGESNRDEFPNGSIALEGHAMRETALPPGKIIPRDKAGERRRRESPAAPRDGQPKLARPCASPRRVAARPLKPHAAAPRRPMAPAGGQSALGASANSAGRDNAESHRLASPSRRPEHQPTRCHPWATPSHDHDANLLSSTRKIRMSTPPPRGLKSRKMRQKPQLS